MKNSITERQKQLLVVIYDFLTSTGYPPTFEDMRENLRVASNQSVVDLLKKLQGAGYVKKNAGARSIAITRLGYEALGRPALAPILGTTTAGLPAEAIEIAGEWQRLSKDISRLAEEVFMLKISGDSMINAGIDDGDAVLVQSKKEFISGEIVYAEIGDEGTVKRFISEDKPPYVYLRPENPKYDNILFTDEVQLKGKIVSVLKGNYWQAVK
ncbi:MAG: repressor LexA [Candidatus Ryanbacteria bacterium RIFCSPLOWO2_01_FULL_47_79]|uniref:Repressor LexA n=1 Tax=Candidatus Yanofskybacteria bacterium RIFCSPLOWO2_02_FULL_45_10 TaxID=1802706 RepID=A0A1F8H767_9BACT|nr:MAG: repressor LexA [Candidatus Yanofskybacteria bacterium RIFCSPLOWO2_02_FULL_45_10]OGZ52712.1 MAG: repressor LexA [Candidatus Ryanbacteria bacterium RIFCSPLOWO2_01_FULL_47_79]